MNFYGILELAREGTIGVQYQYVSFLRFATLCNSIYWSTVILIGIFKQVLRPTVRRSQRSRPAKVLRINRKCQAFIIVVPGSRGYSDAVLFASRRPDDTPRFSKFECTMSPPRFNKCSGIVRTLN